jgi:chorismate synthase
MMRFLTAGESHGPALVAIIEGLPSGLALAEADVNLDLRRRQGGHGRGGRQLLERDQVEFLGGLDRGRTTGAPLAMRIANKDWQNAGDAERPPVTVPRPGHADLAGSLKYGLTDLRVVAERASARETAARVAVGAVAKALLRSRGVAIYSFVSQIGQASAFLPSVPAAELHTRAEASPVRCPDVSAGEAMMREIDLARAAGDSLGGVFQVVATGAPAGLGSYVQWDRRLDGLLAQAVMSIPAIKGVEVGDGFALAGCTGTQAQDAIALGPDPTSPEGLARPTNHAGGIEGGVSNGQAIVVRAAMKPIPTTVTPQQSVDLATMTAAVTSYIRSDVCAVPAASIVGEAMVAWVLACALLERQSGDQL